MGTAADYSSCRICGWSATCESNATTHADAARWRSRSHGTDDAKSTNDAASYANEFADVWPAGRRSRCKSDGPNDATDDAESTDDATSNAAEPTDVWPAGWRWYVWSSRSADCRSTRTRRGCCGSCKYRDS